MRHDDPNALDCGPTCKACEANMQAELEDVARGDESSVVVVGELVVSTTPTTCGGCGKKAWMLVNRDGRTRCLTCSGGGQ